MESRPLERSSDRVWPASDDLTGVDPILLSPSRLLTRFPKAEAN